MTSVRLARTLPPRPALAQLASAGATGVLHVRGRPGGVVHLTGGQVNHVECPVAPGVRTLLTASGRLDPDTWDRTAAASPGEVGKVLVELGHLTRGELELSVLGAIYDAAFFALSGTVTEVRFAAEGRHWLGVVQLVDVDQLVRETDRRINLLGAVHKDSTVDDFPVAPLRRPPRAPVVLSPLQWQIVVHADGRRTPSALAHLLGKPAFTVVLEVRRLAAANLLDVPAGTDSKPAPASPAPVPAKRRGGKTPAETGAPEKLPRRRAGRRAPAGAAELARRATAAADEAATPETPAKPVDESMLVRIRAALEALP